MARFFGNIGFVETYESSPGVWSERIVPKKYSGDVSSERRRFSQGQSVNDDLVFVNYISVICDKFMNENFQMMRWVEWKGAKWQITAVELDYPRAKINFGGKWNE